MDIEQALNTAKEAESAELSGALTSACKVLAAEVRELRESIANVRAAAQMGGVYLQSARDGVWAHFRVGNGYAYSVCLSSDQMSRPFAVEYATAHKALTSKAGA